MCQVHLSLWGGAFSGASGIASNVFFFPHSSYEHLDALDGGDDGMRVIKAILALAPSLLKVSG